MSPMSGQQLPICHVSLRLVLLFHRTTPLTCTESIEAIGLSIFFLRTSILESTREVTSLSRDRTKRTYGHVLAILQSVTSCVAHRARDKMLKPQSACQASRNWLAIKDSKEAGKDGAVRGDAARSQGWLEFKSVPPVCLRSALSRRATAPGSRGSRAPSGRAAAASPTWEGCNEGKPRDTLKRQRSRMVPTRRFPPHPRKRYGIARHEEAAHSIIPGFQA